MVDVQKLMNMEGAGKAEEEVKRLGYWDESNFDESLLDGNTMFEFRFKVTGYYEPKLETESVTVYAYSMEEAERAVDDMIDFDTIEDMDLMKVSEASSWK